MGYLTDNIPPGKGYAICQDLYKYRLIVDPGFLSDVDLSTIIKEEIPDIEEWQYSGRRRWPIAPSAVNANPIQRSVAKIYAQDSRYVRPFTEKVYYAFHTTDERAQVMARFDIERITYRAVNEPN